MKRLVQKLQRHARPLWLLKRAWLRLCGVEIGRGARIAPGAQVKRQGGRIVIGPDCTIHDGARLLAAGGSIVLGRNCSVNPGCILYGHGGLTVGDDVRMAAYTVLVPANHRFDDPARPICEQGESREGIQVGNDVWFGIGAVVLDGVRVADGCVVGAGAVVARSTEPMGIYVGNPARRVRDRGAASQRR
ncbi:MAG: acyltransferase [Phycisphaerales bacterium]